MQQKDPQDLNVLLFSHSAGLYGAERSLLSLVEQLVHDHKISCTVVIPNTGPLKIELEEAGADVLVIDYRWWCHPEADLDRLGNQIPLSVINIMGQIEKFQQTHPDVILTNTIVIPWGAMAAALLDVPHVWFIQERLSGYNPGSLSEIKEIIMDSSDKILVTSDAVEKDWFGNLKNDRCMTIYPAVEIPAGAELKTDQPNYLHTSSLKLLIYGKITANKGQMDAVQAVNLLKKDAQDIELLIMGDSTPDYLKELNGFIESNQLESCIKLIPFSENPFPVINQADVVLICSRQEAFGRVVAEAMLMKKPVIGTSAGGIPETIQDGLNGFLYQPGDYSQLAEKIRYYLKKPELIQNQGEYAYQYVKNKYTRANAGGRVARLFRTLKGGKNPSSGLLVKLLLTECSRYAFDLQNQLGWIEQTIPWRILARIQRGIERVLPSKTRRRRSYEWAAGKLRSLVNWVGRKMFYRG